MQTFFLKTAYLAKLSNAEHDGITNQINERLSEFTTDNQMLITTVETLHAARLAELTAFKRFSGKDFISDDIKIEDKRQKQYMVAVRGILNALMALPVDESLQRQAAQTAQVFKDFQFSIRDGYEATARKIINMMQEWNKAGKYDLKALGIKTWTEKALNQANKVLSLINTRVDNKTAFVKGELVNARKTTDDAIRKVYDVLKVLNNLQPSEELDSLLNTLGAIEQRARQYYISGSKVQKPNEEDEA